VPSIYFYKNLDDKFYKAFLRQADKPKNFEKNQKELRNLFETKRDIIDRMESTMLNYIILFLTLIQGISIILPMIFGGTNFPINQIYGVGIVTFSFIVYIFARKYRLRKIFKNRKI